MTDTRDEQNVLFCEQWYLSRMLVWSSFWQNIIRSLFRLKATFISIRGELTILRRLLKPCWKPLFTGFKSQHNLKKVSRCFDCVKKIGLSLCQNNWCCLSKREHWGFDDQCLQNLKIVSREFWISNLRI